MSERVGTKSYGSKAGRPGLAEAEVARAADSLTRAGKRPTVAAVRKITGGSNATVARLLDGWWRAFSGRLAHGPAAFDRIPGALAHVAEALWLQTVSEARASAKQEFASDARVAERDKADLEVRSHVLSLREAEMEERVRKRETGYAELEGAVRSLTVLLRKEQASKEAAERQIMELKAKLEEASKRRPPGIARVTRDAGKPKRKRLSHSTPRKKPSKRRLPRRPKR
jgi:hypothetical protein